MNPMLEVARKEVRQMRRTKRLYIVGGILLFAMLLLSVLLPAILGRNEFAAEMFDLIPGYEANAAMLFFLSGVFVLGGYFLMQLMPVVLMSDAVCGEWSNKTLFLLLSKPVSRVDMVLGKYLGIGGTLTIGLCALLILDYFIVMLIVPGTPSGSAVLAFLSALILIALGIMAFAAVSLFFSALMRSTLVSTMMTVLMWIIVFPIIGRLDFIIALIRHGTDVFLTNDPESLGIGWSMYFSPGALMEMATPAILHGTEGEGELLLAFTGTNAGNFAGAAIGLLFHIVLWVGLAIVVVRNRDYE